MKKIISHNRIDDSCSHKARKCLNFVSLFITVMLAMLGLCNLSVLAIYHHNVSASREQIETKNEKKANKSKAAAKYAKYLDALSAGERSAAERAYSDYMNKWTKKHKNEAISEKAQKAAYKKAKNAVKSYKRKNKSDSSSGGGLSNSTSSSSGIPNPSSSSSSSKSTKSDKEEDPGTNKTASTGSSGSATGNKCGSVNTYFKWGCNSGTNDEDIVTTVVKSILKWMAAGVGAACMIGILVSAFLYVTAKDNASQAQQAVTGLKYAIGALIVFAAAGTILNFLIPGGLN